MLKVLITDGKGTLGLPTPSVEIHELIGALSELGMVFAAASNSRNAATIVQGLQEASLPIPAAIATQSETKERKPSPQYVLEIQRQTGAAISEIAYLGDDDRTDMFCAINAHVLPLAARYANPNMQYGIPVTTPKSLQRYLETFGQQPEPYFGWYFSGNGAENDQLIDVRVLIGDHGSMGLTNVLKSVLKDNRNLRIGSYGTPVPTILFHYLVSQLYMSGLIQEVDWITTYPGHAANSSNLILDTYSRDLAPIFKDQFKPELLMRHKDAEKSQFIDSSRRSIINQLQTILVNPQYKGGINGKTILVLDDFTTTGQSLEAARRMLLEAGARKVVGVAIAKYRTSHDVSEISQHWNPFEPCNIKEDEVQIRARPGRFNSEADNYFRDQIWPIYSA